MRHRVSLQEAAETADGDGGQSIVWNEVAALWAQIEPLRGREITGADKIEARLTHKVRIRHRSGVTAAMRLAFGTRIFAIHAVIGEAERGRFLLLYCEEGAPE